MTVPSPFNKKHFVIRKRHPGAEAFQSIIGGSWIATPQRWAPELIPEGLKSDWAAQNGYLTAGRSLSLHLRTDVLGATREESESVENALFGTFKRFASYYGAPVAGGILIDSDFSPSPAELDCSGASLDTLLTDKSAALIVSSPRQILNSNKNYYDWTEILQNAGFIETGLYNEHKVLMPDRSGVQNVLRLMFGSKNFEDWKAREISARRDDLIRAVELLLENRILKIIDLRVRAQLWKLCKAFNPAHEAYQAELSAIAYKATEAASNAQRMRDIRQRAGFEAIDLSRSFEKDREEYTAHYTKKQEEFYDTCNRADPRTQAEAASLLAEQYGQYTEDDAKALKERIDAFLAAHEDYQKEFTEAGQIPELIEKRDFLTQQIATRRDTIADINSSLDFGTEAYGRWRLQQLENHPTEIRRVSLWLKKGPVIENRAMSLEEIERLADPDATTEHARLAKAHQPIPAEITRAVQIQPYLKTGLKHLGLEPLSPLEPPSEKLSEHPTIIINKKIVAEPNLPARAQLYLDESVRIYNPVLHGRTSAQSALIERPVIITQGADYIREKLAELGYTAVVSEETINKIEKEKEITERIQTPNRDLYGTECLAYYNYGPMEAQESVTAPDGQPVWIKGKNYLITPGWKTGTDIIAQEQFAGENESEITEQRSAAYQYTFWSVETESGSVEIKETANRQEIETEESLRRDPFQSVQNRAAQSLAEELQQQDEDAMRIRVELNANAMNPEDDAVDAQDPAPVGPPPLESVPWAPCLDEFVATFPPPIPLPVMVRYEQELTQLISKAYARFGPKYLIRAMTDQPLQVDEAVKARAEEIYASEKKPEWPTWNELPLIDHVRFTAATEPGPINPHRFRDRVKYYDRAEGRLENILTYQLREAAIGAFKGSAINNTSQGGGKTLTTIMQLYLMGCKNAYIITGRKLLKNWRDDCAKVGIRTNWIKGPEDAKALAQKLKSGKKDPNPEPVLHLISVEWICLGGKANMKYLPWKASMKLSTDYLVLSTEIGLFLLGPNHPTVNQYRTQKALSKAHSDYKKRRTRRGPADLIDPEPPPPADEELILRIERRMWEASSAWFHDPERAWTIEGVSLEQHLAQHMDRGWIIDAQKLTHYIDTQDSASSKVSIQFGSFGRPVPDIISVIAEGENARVEATATELRIEGGIPSYKASHRHCPKCENIDRWTGHHCHACGHQARYYSSQTTHITTLDRKAKKLKIFSGDKKSSRSYPGYKLLPKVDAKVIDEFHLYTSFSTLHGKAIHDIKTTHTIVTSGTMVRRRVSQVQPALVLVHRSNSPEFPYNRQDMSGFVKRFATHEVVLTERNTGEKVHRKVSRREAPEASNLNALRRLLHGRVIGVDEETVEREWKLDKIVERIVRFELTENEDQAYHRILNDVNAWQAALKAKMATGTYEEIKEARKELMQGTRNRLDLLKTVCNGPSKLKAAVRWAHQVEMDGERAVIVCKSVKLFEDMKTVLEASGLPFDCIDEKISTDDRFEALDQFAAKKKPVLLSRIKLICEGFNQLVCTTRQLFLELEDITGHNRQMQKRSNRPGQKSRVHCDFLVGVRTGDLARQTIDEIQLGNFVRRDRALAELTSRSNRYRGPTALMEEYQEKQGLLKIMEELAENKISEIKAASFQAKDGDISIIEHVRGNQPQLLAS